jgi:hypothetical protein
MCLLKPIYLNNPIFIDDHYKNKKNERNELNEINEKNKKNYDNYNNNNYCNNYDDDTYYDINVTTISLLG